jgi:hypothetical protein
MGNDRATPRDLSQVLADLPPDFAFFEAAYRDHVEPDLLLREERRLAAVARQKQYGLMAVALGAALAAGGFLFFRSPIGLIVGFLAGIALYGWASTDLQQVGKEAKALLVEPISREFGMSFEHALSEDPVDIVRMKNLGLVPGWDRARFEDRLVGKRADTPFEFFEAHLEDKRTTTERGLPETVRGRHPGVSGCWRVQLADEAGPAP